MKARIFVLGPTTFLFIAISWLGGCQPSKVTVTEIARQDFPVATIDSTVTIPATKLYERLAAGKLLEKGGILDSSTFFDTLKAIVVDSVVSTEAGKINLRDDIVLYRIFQGRYNDFFLNYFYRKYIIDSIKVDSIVVDSFYRAHPEKYSNKEQVHARQLVISADGLRYGKDSSLYKNYTLEQIDSVAKDMIYSLRARIDTGEVLGNLAYLYSVNRESGDKYGELEYFTRNTYNEEFEEQAFSLPPGEISQPFRSRDGWHIIQVIDHLNAGLAPLTPEVYGAVSMQFASEMAGGRARYFIDSLVSQAKIIFNDSALLKEARHVPETTWAAVINGIDTITFYRLGDIFDQYSIKPAADSVMLKAKHAVLLREAYRYLAMQAGQQLGYADAPVVLAEREQLYHKYAMDVVRKGGQDPEYMPSDSLISDYYERNIDRFTFKKPIYVQHIIVQDSLFGEFLRDQALSGVDFLGLAKQYYPGAEEIRVAAADLGYIGPGEMPENFYRAAWGTARGNVSHPVKTEWGYHIIKVIDRKNDKPLTEVKSLIIDALRIEHARELTDRWEKEILGRHRIEYHLEKLKRIELPPKARR